MSVFVYAQGIKTVNAGGDGGSKNGKIMSTQLLNAPLLAQKKFLLVFNTILAFLEIILTHHLVTGVYVFCICDKTAVVRHLRSDAMTPLPLAVHKGHFKLIKVARLLINRMTTTLL